MTLSESDFKSLIKKFNTTKRIAVVFEDKLNKAIEEYFDLTDEEQDELINIQDLLTDSIQEGNISFNEIKEAVEKIRG